MDYTTLGATAVVAIMGYKAIEAIVKLLVPKNNVDNKQEINIAVMQKLQEIQGNDLVHIKADLETIKITVAEIKVRLEEVL